MGCDIHTYVERRVDGQWQPVGGNFIQYGDVDVCIFRIAKPVAVWNWRTYSVFAFLAGVRNDHDVRPIAEPRGLPDDVSAPVRAMSDYDNGDGHSHSWLSLPEILAFDWKLPDNGYDGGFLKWVREVLVPLGDPSNVRIVFWFDN